MTRSTATMESASTSAASEAATQPGAGSRRPRPGRRWQLFIEAWALPLLTIAVGAFFSLWPRTSGVFLTSANLNILLGTQAVVAVVALGALVPLIAGQWDLSVGATAGLVAVVAAQFLSHSGGILLAAALGLGVGCFVGLINALITTKAYVNAVITTLGMSTIIAGIVNQRTNGLAFFTNIPQSVVDFGTGTWLGLPRTVFVVIALALVIYYVLDHTPYGRQLYALGSNPSAARLVGIRSGLILGTSFVIAGGLAAAGGLLQFARAGGADPNVGAGFTLPALAAAFLSAASIRPGKYNVGGTLVAILFLAVLNSGLDLAGTPPYVGSYVNGSALIVGVGLAAWLGRKNQVDA